MTDSPPPDRPRVLVAVDDPQLRERVQELLQRQGIDVEVTQTAGENLADEMGGEVADAVVVHRDQITREDVSDLEDPEVNAPGLIVLDRNEDPKDRAQILASGASAVLDASSSNSDLGEELATMAKVEAEGGLDGPEVGGSNVEPDLADFHSRSPKMKEFVDLVTRVAESETSLLVCGETGVGKERLARAIHRASPRRTGPFVAVNCGALPENLLESELFGHEKGAFTGADSRRIGRFEQADQGSILLDEIGEMPPHLQVNLLTILQRREVTRLGGTAPIPVNVRVLAATNRELEEDIKGGRFREDLYYRLNVVHLVIPPLRERPEDLPDLIGRFLYHFRGALNRESVDGITDEAMAALLHHEWPGNIRELINTLERATLLARGNKITLQDLPPAITGTESLDDTSEQDPASSVLLDLSLADAKKRALANFEVGYFRGLLKRFAGNVGETARHADINPRTLYDKLRKYGLDKDEFK